MVARDAVLAFLRDYKRDCADRYGIVELGRVRFRGT
jgi:hypothetical protein